MDAASDERGSRGRRNRAVPIPRCRDQVSCGTLSARGDGGQKPGAPRRPRISRKAIAQGMPGVPAALCCLRAQSALFFARKARGCGQHPAFPAPSSLQEGEISQTPDMRVAGPRTRALKLRGAELFDILT